MGVKHAVFFVNFLQAQRFLVWRKGGCVLIQYSWIFSAYYAALEEHPFLESTSVSCLSGRCFRFRKVSVCHCNFLQQHSSTKCKTTGFKWMRCSPVSAMARTEVFASITAVFVSKTEISVLRNAFVFLIFAWISKYLHRAVGALLRGPFLHLGGGVPIGIQFVF